MCRMFGLRGDIEFAKNITNALVKAAAHDSFSKGKVAHKDGWGAAVYADSREVYMRSARPIFEDPEAQAIYSDMPGGVVCISHARLAAPKEPVRGPIDSHPFRTSIAGSIVYLSHNGWVDKHKLAPSLGLDADNMNDTEVLLYAIAAQSGSVRQKIEGAVNNVVRESAMLGALNLIVLELDHSGSRNVYFYCDYPKDRDPLYYDLYCYAGPKGRAVMSSTVAYEAGLIDQSGQPLSPDVKRAEKRVLGEI
ncbi:MAG: class II glutamine amidotransferase [Thermoprotei archaeon]